MSAWFPILIIVSVFLIAVASAYGTFRAEKKRREGLQQALSDVLFPHQIHLQVKRLDSVARRGAAKHSRASTIVINIFKKENKVEMTIIDAEGRQHTVRVSAENAGGDALAPLISAASTLAREP